MIFNLRLPKLPPPVTYAALLAESKQICQDRKAWNDCIRRVAVSQYTDNFKLRFQAILVIFE